MEHNIETYLKRRSTAELESMLQYFLQSQTQHDLEIQAILKELSLRKA